ncbi:MAG: hypothetical protein ACLRNA_10315 [Gemmiger formicilis]|uniref:hypothetical protein n=1 Tax=Gemmiger formicilis TaxID=745368 RepID=UPI003A1FAD54
MMERAMQRMTVESMLKQAGADAESIRQLNRVLQGIKRMCDFMGTYCNPLDLGYRYQHMRG